jgi:GT2 family glycosyltransferase
MLDLPAAADSSLLDHWQTELPFGWSLPSSHADEAVSRSKVTLAVTGLTPGWYHLNVWIDGDSALVTGRMRYIETRLGELPIKLEPRRGGRFSKILKIAEPVSLVTIAADGARAKGLSRIEIRRLGLPTVCAFIARKGVRYLLANRHGLDLAAAYRQLSAAFQTRANFAFRDGYEPEDIEAAYPRWRAIHEDPFACQRAASVLERRLAPRRARVALLLADGFDPAITADAVRSSLLSPVVDLVPVVLSAGSAPSLEGCDFLLPIDHAGRMRRGGVERMVLALTDDRRLSGVFADSDTVDCEGVRGQPRLKPPADRELLWCTDYIRAPLLVRAEPDLIAALAAPGAAQSPGYALAFALIERDRGALGHIPEILFHELPDSPKDRKRATLSILQEHLERGSVPTTVTARADGIRQVAWPVPCEAASVSIIIPSKDKPELLKACIDTIQTRTTGIAPQIIVADNGSTLPSARAYLDAIAAEGTAIVVPCPGPFNFPKINNQARLHASGRILVLLNDDTQVVSADWLTELASIACRPDVGAVGSKLLYPDGTIQHAGVVLGIGGAGDHAFRYLPGDAPGYLDLIRCRREVSAVTGACLAVSAAHFDLVDGLDEELPVTLNDVDFCLRLRDRGLINIWTPWAVLEHWESKSRGTDHTDAALDRQAAELALFTRRWGHLMAQDPHYHPGLSRLEPDYRLAV